MIKEHPTDAMMRERLEALARDLAEDPPCEYVREGVASVDCRVRGSRPESDRCCYACRARAHVGRAVAAFTQQAEMVRAGLGAPTSMPGGAGRALHALRSRGVVRG